MGKNRMEKYETKTSSHLPLIRTLKARNTESEKYFCICISHLYLQSYFPRHVWQANSLERLGQTDSVRKARISEKQIKAKLLSQSKKSYPADLKEKLLKTVSWFETCDKCFKCLLLIKCKKQMWSFHSPSNFYLGKNSLESYCRSRKNIISSHWMSHRTMLILSLNLFVWQFIIDIASFFLTTRGGK